MMGDALGVKEAVQSGSLSCILRLVVADAGGVYHVVCVLPYLIEITLQYMTVL